MSSSYVFFYLLGLGCNFKIDKVTDEMKDLYSDISGIKDVRIKCNSKFMDTLSHIVKTCIRPRADDDPFINEISDEIKQLLQKGKTVIVFGHSYGGAVAGHIAEQLNNISTKKSLHVRTFGSIYLPITDDVVNVDIINYIFENDVSMRCNTSRSLYMNDELVLLPDDMFDLDEWKLHNKYHYFTTELAKNMKQIINGKVKEKKVMTNVIRELDSEMNDE